MATTTREAVMATTKTAASLSQMREASTTARKGDSLGQDEEGCTNEGGGHNNEKTTTPTRMGMAMTSETVMTMGEMSTAHTQQDAVQAFPENAWRPTQIEITSPSGHSTQC